MSFRKKRVEVTQELLHEILREVTDKFLDSPAPKYLKQHIRRCNPVFHIVNRPKWNIYGQAYLCSRWVKADIAKMHMKLSTRKHPTTVINNEVYFLVIQINVGAWRSITKRGLRYLIAHEFGHIAQIVIDEEVDGQYSYSTDSDHDHRWLRLTKWMGGTGSERIPKNEIWC